MLGRRPDTCQTIRENSPLGFCAPQGFQDSLSTLVALALRFQLWTRDGGILRKAVELAPRWIQLGDFVIQGREPPPDHAELRPKATQFLGCLPSLPIQTCHSASVRAVDQGETQLVLVVLCDPLKVSLRKYLDFPQEVMARVFANSSQEDSRLATDFPFQRDLLLGKLVGPSPAHTAHCPRAAWP